MAARFSDAELEQFMFDPKEPASWSVCPFCGGTVVVGVRKATRNIAIAHDAHPDPTDPTRTRFISGCEPFNDAIGHPDVMRRLFNAGARFFPVAA